MSTNICRKRLLKEFKLYESDTTGEYRYFSIKADENDMQKIYYVIHGLSDEPYKGGFYLGEIGIPNEYPFKAPTFMMLTPSGRFNPGQKLCINGISHYHAESWSAENTVPNMMIGLISFMQEGGMHDHVGAINDNNEARKKYAAESYEYNVKRIAVFAKLFPELIKKEN